MRDDEYDFAEIFMAVIIASCSFFAGMALGRQGHLIEFVEFKEIQLIEDAVPAKHQNQRRQRRDGRRHESKHFHDDTTLVWS